MFDSSSITYYAIRSVLWVRLCMLA